MKKPWPWEDLLTDIDRKVIEQAGYGQSRGLGRRPVFLLIDAQYNYFGDDKEILEQLEDWPSGAGQAAWRTMDGIKKLLAAFRSKGLPVIYTRQVQDRMILDGFAMKAAGRNQQLYLEGSRGTEIVDELKPLETDFVINKTQSSAFLGTPLPSLLTRLKVDTVIIAGGTTCGCVRATAVESVSRGYDTVVLHDCVFDRITLSHKASLLDLWMKYCDLLDTSEVVDYLAGLDCVS